MILVTFIDRVWIERSMHSCNTVLLLPILLGTGKTDKFNCDMHSRTGKRLYIKETTTVISIDCLNCGIKLRISYVVP